MFVQSCYQMFCLVAGRKAAIMETQAQYRYRRYSKIYKGVKVIGSISLAVSPSHNLKANTEPSTLPPPSGDDPLCHLRTRLAFALTF